MQNLSRTASELFILCKPLNFISLLTIGLFFLGLPAFAQQAANSKSQPDTLILTDGEKLIGQFLHSTGTSVVFKSDLAGEGDC